VWIALFFLIFTQTLLSQTLQKTDSISIKSNKTDSLPFTTKSSLQSPIHYDAQDSLTLWVNKATAQLYHKAHVQFDQTDLQARFIEVRLNKKILFAKGGPDSAGNYSDKPQFKDKGETYEADSMIYSSSTQKGKVYGLHLKQDAAYVQLQAVVKQPNGAFIGANGKLTTCDDPNPHFYLNTSKIKIIPNNKAFFGPANMVFLGIPTPLALPFGLAPLQKGRRNGILMPNYGYFRPNKSFFLSNLGYYTALGQFMDLTVATDVFLNGDLRGKIQTNFSKRYHWKGNLNLQASRFGNGLDFANPEYKKTIDFGITGQFNMDPKLLPGITLNGNINIVTGNFNKKNAQDVRSLNNNQFTSSVNYGQNFFKNKMNLTASARHSQNTQTRDFRIELPNINLGVSSLTPFAKKNSSNSKWYQQLRLGYNMNYANVLNTKDTIIFSDKYKTAFDNLQSGVKHRIPISTNVKLFKGVLNLTPSFNYSETWYFQAKLQNWDIANKKVAIRDTMSFFRLYNYDATANLNTNIYGTFNKLKIGRIRAIRHTITPSIGFTYRPEIDGKAKGWTRSYIDSGNKTRDYSIFASNLYGGTGQVGGGAITYGIGNNFQAKKIAKTDTTGGKKPEKVNIIDQLSFNGNYNMFADSLKFSDINSTLNTVLFKQLRIGLTASHSFYEFKNGHAINNFYVNSSGMPLRFKNFNANVSSKITPDMFKSKSKTEKSGDGNLDKTKDADPEELEQVKNQPWDYYDFSKAWSIGFTYNLNLNSEHKGYTGNNLTNNRLTINGDINITDEWKIAYSTGYDFMRKQVASSQFTVVRSLHCWQLEFTFIPSGYGKQWLFSLRPKSPLLRDLKINRTVTSNPALIQMR